MDISKLLSGLKGHQPFQHQQAPAQPVVTAQAETDTGPGPLDPARAQALLNQQLLAKLNERLAPEGVKLQDLNPDDFTPEAVADRILGFIRGVVGGAENDEQRSELLQQARAGVEQGLAEARDILDSLGVLNGEIAANVDRTEALLFKGLDAMANPDAESPVEAPEVALTRNALQSVAVQRQQSGSIEIETADGDRVTIDFARSFSASRTEARAENAAGEAFLVEASRSSSTSFAFRVEGELDADEQQAIGDLLKRIDKVSDQFFAGNVQAAFKQAAKLGISSEEIVGFSVDLNASVTRQAVSAYETTAARGEGEPAINPAQQLADFVSRVRDTLNSRSAALFAEPGKAVGELLTGVTETKAGVFGFDADEITGPLAQLKALIETLQEERLESDKGAEGPGGDE